MGIQALERSEAREPPSSAVGEQYEFVHPHKLQQTNLTALQSSQLPILIVSVLL